MNTIIRHSLLTFALVCALSSCSDFLSVVPDNRTHIDSKEKIGELLTLAYPDVSHQMFCYFMSDNATHKKGELRLTSAIEDAYNWRDFRDVSQDTPEMYWSNCYAAIKQANHALDYLQSDYRRSDGTYPPDVRGYYAEALLSRAYCHFMLAQLWAKSYNPSTASTSLGIPYVKSVEREVFVKYTRSTSEDTYKQIEADLIEGLKYVESINYPQHKKLHWNREAAYAFASRFYSILGQFEKVESYSSAILSANPAEQLRDVNGRYSSFTPDERYLEWGRPSEVANLLVVPQYSNWGQAAFIAYRYGMSPDMYRFVYRPLFNNRSLLWAWQPYGNADGLMFIKWGLYRDRASASANSGYWKKMHNLFEMEEVLLLRAESRIMLGRYDEAEEDISAYLSKRIRNYNPSLINLNERQIRQHYSEYYENKQVNMSFVKLMPFYALDEKQEVYLNFIYDLRRKEFFFTGNRWFDHKRFNTRVRHWLDDKEQMFLEPNDPRRELQLPEQAISAGLEPNPR